MQRVLMISALAVLAGVVSFESNAHSGGLNAEGCHNNRKTGDYHCHRAPSAAAPTRASVRPTPYRTDLNGTSGSSDTVYANCSEARAAGAAPVRRGDPGYSRKLDRDGDGVGCE